MTRREDETEPLTLDRREMLKTVGAAAAGVAAGALRSAEGAEAPAGEHNPYGAPPGSGVSMPPYYLPTASVRNKNNYFPQSEPLGADEMRIIFMGSQPWPPRLSQASTCIMVELGNGRRFFFDFGPGCLRNIIANQLDTIRHRQAGELLPGPGHHLRHVLAHGLGAQRRGAA